MTWMTCCCMVVFVVFLVTWFIGVMTQIRDWLKTFIKKQNCSKEVMALISVWCIYFYITWEKYIQI